MEEYDALDNKRNMEKTIKEYLSYREELEMAVLYLNLEKLKYLVAGDIFNEDCLLSNDINDTQQRYPLYVIQNAGILARTIWITIKK